MENKKENEQIEENKNDKEEKNVKIEKEEDDKKEKKVKTNKEKKKHKKKRKKKNKDKDKEENDKENTAKEKASNEEKGNIKEEDNKNEEKENNKNQQNNEQNDRNEEGKDISKRTNSNVIQINTDNIMKKFKALNKYEIKKQRKETSLQPTLNNSKLHIPHKKKDLTISLLSNNKRNIIIQNIPKEEKDQNLKGIIYYKTSSSKLNDNLKKELSYANNTYESENKIKYKYNEDEKQSISSYNTAQINNYNYLETKIIKDATKDKFLTLHSGGGDRVRDRFDIYDNIAYIESKAEVFKPYVSKYPEKVFKKRGLKFKRIKLRKKDDNEKETDKKDNKKIIYIKFNNNLASNENKNKKNNLDDNKLNKVEDNKLFSYYQESNNNVYFEIKQFNEKDKDKKSGNTNINQKGVETYKVPKRGTRSKLDIFNSFGVQREALYIPKDN